MHFEGCMTIRTEPAERRPGTVKLDHIRVEDIKYRLAEGESRAGSMVIETKCACARRSSGSMRCSATWVAVRIGHGPGQEA